MPAVPGAKWVIFMYQKRKVANLEKLLKFRGLCSSSRLPLRTWSFRQRTCSFKSRIFCPNRCMLLFWRRFLQNSEAGDQNRPSSCWEKALRVSGIMPLEMETLGLEDLLCHRRRGDDQDGDVTQLQAHDRSLVRDLYCWDTSSRMFPTSGVVSVLVAASPPDPVYLCLPCIRRPRY